MWLIADCELSTMKFYLPLPFPTNSTVRHDVQHKPYRRARRGNWKKCFPFSLVNSPKNPIRDKFYLYWANISLVHVLCLLSKVINRKEQCKLGRGSLHGFICSSFSSFGWYCLVSPSPTSPTKSQNTTHFFLRTFKRVHITCYYSWPNECCV